MKNSEKTIYLHIGMPKAGSTSIQYFCMINSDKLKEKGILYPIFDDKDVQINAQFINYRHIIFDVYKAELKDKHLDEYNNYWEKNVLPIINSTECSKIIFSEEGIWKNNINSEICDVMLKNGFDVKVIAYLRKPAEYLCSFWQEHLKPLNFDLSFNYPLNEFLDKTTANYEILENYIEKLGKDNVIIRAFEKEQWKNNNLYQDFLDCIGIDKIENPDVQRTNEHPFNRDSAEFMQMLRSTCMTQKQFTQYVYEYAKSLAPQEEIEKLDPLNRENNLHIIEKYQPDSPKIINSISDNKILEVTKKHIPILKKLAKVYNKEDLFINYYPDNFSSENCSSEPKYNGLKLSLKQIQILLNAYLNRRIGYEYKGLSHACDLMNKNCDDPSDKFNKQDDKPIVLSNEQIKTFYDSVSEVQSLSLLRSKYDSKVSELKKEMQKNVQLESDIKELNEQLNKQNQTITTLRQELEIYKIPFYQYIISAKNIGDKKILRILGAKITIKRRKNKSESK